MEEMDTFQPTRRFFYLHGMQQEQSIHLYGQLECKDSFQPCTIILSAITKTLHIKLLQHATSNADEFKAEVEKILLQCSNITIMNNYKSEVVRKQTIYKMHEELLKVSYEVQKVLINFTANENMHVYGLKQCAFEQFLLEKQIKGPCWLKLTNFINGPSEQSKVVHCTPEQLHCVQQGNEPIAPLKCMSIDVFYCLTEMETLEPCTISIHFGLINSASEVQLDADSVTLLQIPRFYMLNWKDKNIFLNKMLSRLKRVVVCSNANDLICKLQELLTSHQINVIFCHDIDYLLTTNKDYYNNWKEMFSTCILIDLKSVAREFNFKEDLQSLCDKFAPNASSLELPTVNNMYVKLKQGIGLIYFLKTIALRAEMILNVARDLQAWKFTLYASQLTGQNIRFVYPCTNMKNIEKLLQFEFTRNNVIIPEMSMQDRPKRQTVLGGYIFDALPDYYTSIIVAFDFKSLYPSIVAEYELSCEVDTQTLPNLMRSLLKLRESSAYPQMVKQLSNNIIGCLSSQYSIFYHPNYTSQITLHGRTLLCQLAARSEERTEALVVSGHTDSIFVHLHSIYDYDSAIEYSEEIMQTINDRHAYIRLKCDGIFARGAIFNKLQYALNYHPRYRENGWLMKGFQKARMPPIITSLLQQLLSNFGEDRTPRQLAQTWMQLISKQFKSANFDDYILEARLENLSDTTEHGRLALAHNTRHSDVYKVKDIVSYVACEGGILVDVKSFKDRNLKIDQWQYKMRMVYQFIAKLDTIAPQRIDIDYLRNCLQPHAINTIVDQRRFFRCETFYFPCVHCSQRIVMATYTFKHFMCCTFCGESLLNREQTGAILDYFKRLLNELMRRLKHFNRLKRDFAWAMEGWNLDAFAFAQIKYWRMVLKKALKHLNSRSRRFKFKPEMCRLRELLADALELCRNFLADNDLMQHSVVEFIALLKSTSKTKVNLSQKPIPALPK